MQIDSNIESNGTYVGIRVLNPEKLIQFCQEQGLIASKPDELHVTIAYSRVPFDFKMGIGDNTISIQVGSSRFGTIGENNIVLFIDSIALQCEHQRTLEAGASYDYPVYTPHITIEYESGNVDVSHLQSPMFEILLGAEYIEPLDLDWIQN